MSGTISIVVPVYNSGKGFSRCVESLLASTYGDLEILLVDDGSTDGSGSICDNYAKQDKRVKAVHKKNGGTATARNAGIEAAAGEYISFIDSDDWVEPDYLAKLHEALTAADRLFPVCLAMLGQFTPAPADGYEPSPTDPMSRDMTLTGCVTLADFAAEYLDIEPRWTMEVTGKLCRRQLLDGLRFEPDIIYVDGFLTEWYLRCRNIAVVPGELYHYTQRPGSLTDEKYHNWTPPRMLQFLDTRIKKIERFYGAGFTDCAYSSDRFFIQAILRFLEGMLYLPSSPDSPQGLLMDKFVPELEKRWDWFNKQEWAIRNGKTYWKHK